MTLQELNFKYFSIVKIYVIYVNLLSDIGMIVKVTETTHSFREERKQIGQ